MIKEVRPMSVAKDCLEPAGHRNLPVVGLQSKEGKAVLGPWTPPLIEHPHALLFMSFSGGEDALCFKNMFFVYVLGSVSSAQNGKFMKAEEKLLIFFTFVSLAVLV